MELACQHQALYQLNDALAGLACLAEKDTRTPFFSTPVAPLQPGGMPFPDHAAGVCRRKRLPSRAVR